MRTQTARCTHGQPGCCVWCIDNARTVAVRRELTSLTLHAAAAKDLQAVARELPDKRHYTPKDILAAGELLRGISESEQDTVLKQRWSLDAETRLAIKIQAQYDVRQPVRREAIDIHGPSQPGTLATDTLSASLRQAGFAQGKRYARAAASKMLRDHHGPDKVEARMRDLLEAEQAGLLTD